MSKSQIGSAILKFLPLLFLIIFFVAQNHYANLTLQIYQDAVKQDREMLVEQMSKENISPELGRQILQVSSNSTSNTERLVSSLSRQQILYQFNILLMFWMFFSLLSRIKVKKEDSQSDQ